jgi:transposase
VAGKRGQPCKLTPEVQTRICNAVSAGNYYEAACAYAGISYDTFQNWMRRGREARSGSFFDFFVAVSKAQAEAEVRVVAQWQKHVPENWQAARDFLARRHPERWAQRDILTVVQKAADQVARMSDDELRQLLAGRGNALPDGAGGGSAPGPDSNGHGPPNALPQ